MLKIKKLCLESCSPKGLSFAGNLEVKNEKVAPKLRTELLAPHPQPTDNVQGFGFFSLKALPQDKIDCLGELSS